MGARVVTETKLLFTVGRGRSSTGRLPINSPGDVKELQSGLNEISAEDGGPETPLAVTGFVDDATFNAIIRFQQKQFGWHDGVVDSRHKTLRRLNEMKGTPTSPLSNPLSPAPRLVPQNDEHHCWAASLESWLELTPSEDNLVQDELIEEFRDVIDPETEAMSNPGWARVTTRFHMSGINFANNSFPLQPTNEITAQFIDFRLQNNGYLIIIYNLVPGGPSHVNVVYGVTERNNQTYLKVMDPFTRGNGGMLDRPLSFYTNRSSVAMLWSRKGTP